MKTVPSVPLPSVSPAPAGAARFVSSVKVHQPVVASNRDFVRAWAARRAKLAAAAGRRPPAR
ncbi:MAG: hypothetical protein NTV51_22700 [Verrucomicrobia bacterium]|nr:hypothetical protein [Verrucomicrobiota bacterium]